jgi:uncharacterized membrane protein YphA (DoxX/SURF4 family)
MSSPAMHFGTATVAPRAARVQSKANVALWVLQSVLALLFLFAGVVKLVSPAAALAAQSHLPGEFMKFIGVAETLGALGLVLPGMTRIAVGLTRLAAIGLQIIMVGAVVVTLIQGPAAGAIVPLIVGLLCAVVAQRRRHG